MKLKLLHIGAGLLCACAQAPAQQPDPKNGRLDLGNGTEIEYRVAAYDKNVYQASKGHIGPVFGTDGGVPHTKLERLTFLQGKKRTLLDVVCMYDPWFERVDSNRFRVRAISSTSLLLTGTFSDAAGSYVAEWLIVDGVGVRTLLSNEPSVVRDKLRH